MDIIICILKKTRCSSLWLMWVACGSWNGVQPAWALYSLNSYTCRDGNIGKFWNVKCSNWGLSVTLGWFAPFPFPCTTRNSHMKNKEESYIWICKCSNIYLPVNLLGLIFNGLYFSHGNVFSVECMKNVYSGQADSDACNKQICQNLGVA